MKNVEVLNNQTLFDIALQETGSVESVFMISRLNNLSLPSKIDSYTIKVTKVIEETIVSKLTEQKPATSVERQGELEGNEIILSDGSILNSIDLTPIIV